MCENNGDGGGSSAPSVSGLFFKKANRGEGGGRGDSGGDGGRDDISPLDTEIVSSSLFTSKAKTSLPSV